MISYAQKDNQKIYKVWSGIKQRCFNPNSNRYKNYGGRGISICDEWKNSFETFCKWALENGYKEGLSIDRIDREKITNQVIVDGQMKLHNKITGQTILCMNMKEKRILLQNGLGLKELNQRHFAQGGEEGIGDRI